MIDITNTEVLKDLSSFDYVNQFIDLHNDYECLSLKYFKEKKEFQLSFEPRIKNLISNRITIFFEEIEISKCCIYFSRTIDSSTLNIFYRGRFETDGKLLELNSDNKTYWYIEFEDGDILELFPSKVLVNIEQVI